MPLISLTAAQRSTFHMWNAHTHTFLTPIHPPVLDTSHDLRPRGNAGSRCRTEANLHGVDILFMGRFLELRRGPGASWRNVRMTEREVWRRVYDQAAACMRDLRYTYMGRPFLTRSGTTREKRSEPRRRGR